MIGTIINYVSPAVVNATLVGLTDTTATFNSSLAGWFQKSDVVVTLDKVQATDLVVGQSYKYEVAVPCVGLVVGEGTDCVIVANPKDSGHYDANYVKQSWCPERIVQKANVIQ